MLEAIEKLLILQDRDRKIQRAQIELAHVGPEREALQERLSGAQAALDAAKLKAKQFESDRKELELEAQSKKEQIQKYSLQQLQTKKNDEYRALANEIDHCKEAIVKLEDQELDLMEQGEAAQKESARAAQALNEAKKMVDALAADLTRKEEVLQKDLEDLQAHYDQLTGGLEESTLIRYLRLRKSKGGSAVVGIEHSVCGGCHMTLPRQVVLSCQAHQEIISCPTCGRILYYTPHMDLVVVD